MSNESASNESASVLDRGKKYVVNARQRPMVNSIFREFKTNPLAMAGLFMVFLMGFLSIAAPIVAPHDPSTQNIADAQLASPSLEYPFGTDKFGRDVLSRIIYGSRISLQVGVIAVSVGVAIGVPLGLISGYVGDYVDETVMRAMDIVLAFPAILLALSLVAVAGQSVTNLMIAIGIVSTPGFARVTRSEVLSIREEAYITASNAMGYSHLSIVVKDILPNVVAPTIVQATIMLAFAILAESGLSFLGVGAPPPTPSWGRMLAASRGYMGVAWWTAVFPGIAIVIAVLGFNFLGDALRDALDPKNTGDRLQ